MSDAGKVRVITGMLGDRSGAWVSFDDFKRMEDIACELNAELDIAEQVITTTISRNILNERKLDTIRHHLDWYVEMEGTVTLRDVLEEILDAEE